MLNTLKTGVSRYQESRIASAHVHLGRLLGVYLLLVLSGALGLLTIEYVLTDGVLFPARGFPGFEEVVISALVIATIYVPVPAVALTAGWGVNHRAELRPEVLEQLLQRLQAHRAGWVGILLGRLLGVYVLLVATSLLGVLLVEYVVTGPHGIVREDIAVTELLYGFAIIGAIFYALPALAVTALWSGVEEVS